MMRGFHEEAEKPATCITSLMVFWISALSYLFVIPYYIHYQLIYNFISAGALALFGIPLITSALAVLAIMSEVNITFSNRITEVWKQLRNVILIGFSVLLLFATIGQLVTVKETKCTLENMSTKIRVHEQVVTVEAPIANTFCFSQQTYVKMRGAVLLSREELGNTVVFDFSVANWTGGDGAIYLVVRCPFGFEFTTQGLNLQWARDARAIGVRGDIIYVGRSLPSLPQQQYSIDPLDNRDSHELGSVVVRGYIFLSLLSSLVLAVERLKFSFS